jgi:dTDP-4-dehydrorhamnose reductase
MKVLITGATGQLGSELYAALAGDFEVIPTTRKELDVTDVTTVRSFVMANEPDVVIHPAAYTDVDGCENNKEKAFLVNAVGARNMAIAARQVGAKLVYISTDYVFDGKKQDPYVEYDPPNPLNIYGWSKLVGEWMVKEQNPRTFILRVAWLYGPRGKNFVKTMLALAREKEELYVVNDQRGTPTFAGDVARQIKALIETDCYGLYHCTSQGSCTWYEFAKEVFRLAGISIRVIPVTSAEFPRPAKRPTNSVLENFMLKVQGLDIMPRWEESLEAQIQRIKEAIEE